MGILRSLEDEMIRDVKIFSSMGSLALVLKGKKVAEEDSESDILESEISKDEYALMVSNPKKFFKKNYSRFRNTKKHGSYSSEKTRDETFKNSSNEDENKENKQLGNSGYDCNYCHVKNCFAKECMLRERNEKEEFEKDKACYLQKIEGLRKKKVSNSKPMLIVQEGGDDEGIVEVWSIDSEDEEVSKPTYGGCFVAKS